MQTRGATISRPSLASQCAQFSDSLGRMEVTGASGVRLDTEAGVAAFGEMLSSVRTAEGAVYLVGNGGSAAVSAHIANDLINVCNLRASTLHEPATLTCMANDYGYAAAYGRLVDTLFRPGDLLIAISSSGRSANIHGAVDKARVKSGQVVTLSGFAPDNPLRRMGNLNFWVPTKDYGLVETAHLFVLHHVVDLQRPSGARI